MNLSRSTKIALAFTFALVPVLVACGDGEPSEKEIQTLVSNSLDQMNVGEIKAATLLDLHKNKCISEGGGFRCTITARIDYKIGGAGVKETTSDILFIKAADGKTWIMKKP